MLYDQTFSQNMQWVETHYCSVMSRHLSQAYCEHCSSCMSCCMTLLYTTIYTYTCAVSTACIHTPRETTPLETSKSFSGPTLLLVSGPMILHAVPGSTIPDSTITDWSLPSWSLAVQSLTGPCPHDPWQYNHWLVPAHMIPGSTITGIATTGQSLPSMILALPSLALRSPFPCDLAV